jgi:hypothetical protein
MVGRSSNKPDRRLRYGGPLFSAASALPIDGGIMHFGPLVRFLAAAVRRPRRVASLASLLLRTQSQRVVLSDSLAGRTLSAYFKDRTFGLLPRHRLCEGVLVLPRHHSEYLRGRRRQALRTNLRRAQTAGISCEPITDPSRALDTVLAIVGTRECPVTEASASHWRALVERPESTLLVAREAHGHPLAIVGVVIDDMVSLIRFSVAGNHDARWALHDYLVRMLIARGVSYLVAEGGGPFGALGLSPGVQHYQHLLGYELRHLTLDTPSPVSRRRRMLSFAAIGLTTIALAGLTLLTGDAMAVQREVPAPKLSRAPVSACVASSLRGMPLLGMRDI